MYVDGKVWMSKNESQQFLLGKMANRHGLIAGATGTGKTADLLKDTAVNVVGGEVTKFLIQGLFGILKK